MRRLSLLTLLTLLALGFMASKSFADDVDDGDFADGAAEAPENTDSEPVPGLSMSAPTYGGTGCPQGTVSATLSPDAKALSLLFDQYIVRTGGGTAGQARAECQVKIPVNVPSGYRVQVVKIEYRGFASVPAGATARVAANLRFDGRHNGAALPMRRFARGKQFVGPMQKNFILGSRLRGGHFTQCGESFTLNSNSAINVVSRRGEEVLAAIDSADAIGRVPVKMHLRWKRCGHGEPDDNRPGRPGDRPGHGGRPGGRR